MEIFVRDGVQLHHLVQDDMRTDVPMLMTLQVGDTVSALVKPDVLGRDIDWLWELRRGDATILRYDSTLNHVQMRAQRLLKVVVGMELIGWTLLMTAILMRMKFGSWRRQQVRHTI